MTDYKTNMRQFVLNKNYVPEVLGFLLLLFFFFFFFVTVYLNITTE